MNLVWIKCGGDAWCPLANVDLDSYKGVNGVYVIWNPKIKSRGSNVVRVGQGDIEDRLTKHLKDPTITRYGKKDLLVTWAVVEGRKARRRIERYLADELNPRVGSRFPDETPIQVNLPGQ